MLRGVIGFNAKIPGCTPKSDDLYIIGLSGGQSGCFNLGEAGIKIVIAIQGIEVRKVGTIGLPEGHTGSGLNYSGFRSQRFP